MNTCPTATANAAGKITAWPLPTNFLKMKPISAAALHSGFLNSCLLYTSFPLNGWTARTGFRVILTACTDNAAATDDFFHDILSLRIRGTNGFFKPSITELKSSVNLFTVCIINLRDEAFYLRKKKRSAGTGLTPISVSLKLILHLASVRLGR